MTELKEQIQREQEQIKRFQDFLIENEGLIISEATLRTDHLLNAAANIIHSYNLPESPIRDLFLILEEYGGSLEDWENVYNESYGMSLSEYADLLWHEDVFDYFNDICPEGFCFGSCEGDGACFGFWQYSEEDLY